MAWIQVRFELATPLLAPQRDMAWTLDRWLAGAAALERFPLMTRRHPQTPGWVPWTELDIPLVYQAALGVFATTQAHFPLGGRLQYDYRTKKAIMPVTPNVASGIFKASHFRQPLWNVPAVEFVADVTDPDRLDTLLDILFANGVGGDRNRGYGTISDVNTTAVSPESHPSVLWDAEGYPTRPVPWARVPHAYQETCREGLNHGTLQLIHQRVVPPAWSAQSQALCIAPRIRWPEDFISPDPTDDASSQPIVEDLGNLENLEEVPS